MKTGCQVGRNSSGRQAQGKTVCQLGKTGRLWKTGRQVGRPEFIRQTVKLGKQADRNYQADRHTREDRLSGRQEFIRQTGRQGKTGCQVGR